MAYALHRRHEGQVMTASGLDVLAGIWLLISPFVIGFASVSAAATNNVVCGIIVTVLAAVRFFGAYRQGWLSWVNCVIGLYTIASPWIVGFARNHHATTNNVVIGIVIAILAFWSAVATNTEDVAGTAMGNRETDIDRGPGPYAG
jgi:hypothetical protein